MTDRNPLNGKKNRPRGIKDRSGPRMSADALLGLVAEFSVANLLSTHPKLAPDGRAATKGCATCFGRAPVLDAAPGRSRRPPAHTARPRDASSAPDAAAARPRPSRSGSGREGSGAADICSRNDDRRRAAVGSSDGATSAEGAVLTLPLSWAAPDVASSLFSPPPLVHRGNPSPGSRLDRSARLM